MATDLAASASGWTVLLRDHARRHRPVVWALSLALLVVLALLLQSLTQVVSSKAAPGLHLALAHRR